MLVPYRSEPPLASCVEVLWYYQGFAEPGHQERVLPNGRSQVVIDLCSVHGGVSGMRSHYVVIDPAAIHAALGVVFWPGGTLPFLPGPAGDYFNQVVSLDLIWVRALESCTSV